MTLDFMTEWGMAGAVALGLLTALHPCPLSTLSATVLLIFSPSQRYWRSLVNGTVLVLGMTVAYMVIICIVAGGLLQIPFFSTVLSRLINPFLAPILLIAGVLRIGLFTRKKGCATPSWREKLPDLLSPNPANLFLLGIVLALAFCPATAGLFFGVLLPFAIVQNQPVVWAIGFGLGYGLPLLAITAFLTLGGRSESLRRNAGKFTVMSGWMLVAIGIFLTWKLF